MVTLGTVCMTRSLNGDCRIKGQDRYLYRAVDSTGQTIEFLLTAERDAAASKRFLVKAIEAPGNAGDLPETSWLQEDFNPGR